MDDLTRRDVLKLGIAAGAWTVSPQAIRAAQPSSLLATPPIELVRIGMVGVGLQGGSHVENFLKIPGCRIAAVCDVREERTTWASTVIAAAGQPAPAIYNRGPRDFERLCETEDLDLVFTATPWE